MFTTGIESRDARIEIRVRVRVRVRVSIRVRVRYVFDTNTIQGSNSVDG